jgi:fumarate reductase subunit D
MTPQEQQPQKSPLQAIGNEPVREQDKIMLVLAYLGILCLIPLITVKDSPPVQWHAKQGLVLNLGGFLVLFVVGFVPVLGQAVGCLGSIAILVLDILAITKALKGERWRVPVVADLADKF